ncbi:PfkB family carbohydrate kinase [Bradyrhizobium sp.]|uniref:PfkB family carbohydrate kinase n=1 Tax=Bradyrhizobium sp. TaxID=376 RepID=UPI004037F9A4
MSVFETRDFKVIVDEIRCPIGDGRKISFVSGNFNVVHPGHLRLLRFAAELSDVLVVGVSSDATPGVTLPMDLRLDSVRSISIVDRVVALKSGPEEFIAALRPDFVVKGKEFEARDNPERSVVEAYGGRLVFSSGELRFSSLSLLEREYTEPNFSAVRKPRDYPFRYAFQMGDLRNSLEKFSGLRVLVVGDLIVDDYITCDPLGMSQEDPTIVVTPIETKTFVGGAGVVAAHARGLGAEVRYCAVVGDDEAAKFATMTLEKQGVAFDRFPDDSRPTTRKQRFRAQNKTLLRVNHLRQHPASPEIQTRMLASVEAALPHTDLILFACFNYGCLPQPLVQAIADKAAARSIMMAADSQASSQLADVSRFRNMTLITPTEREARLALNDFESGLAVIGDRLQAKALAENLVITLGAEGMLINTVKDDVFRTDRLPAFNVSPMDVAGAGDSFFTSASMALCVGSDIWQSAYLGALAAALQVSRVGNTPLAKSDLMSEIDDTRFDVREHT